MLRDLDRDYSFPVVKPKSTERKVDFLPKMDLGRADIVHGLQYTRVSAVPPVVHIDSAGYRHFEAAQAVAKEMVGNWMPNTESAFVEERGKIMDYILAAQGGETGEST